MGRLFGTDGVRGLANGSLTAELALDLSVAAAHVLGEAGAFRAARTGTGLVPSSGRDTRISGQFLEAAVVAGLASAGVDVLLLGVLPTPGVAYLTGAPRRRPRRDDLRQPQPDARQRHQVPRAGRGQARRRDRGRDRAAAARALGPARRRRPSAGSRPTTPRSTTTPRHLRLDADPSAGPRRLDRVVLDCAHGAASEVGPLALRRRRRRRGRDLRRARRPEHQRRLRLDPPRRRCARRSSSTGRRRLRARRRRRPLPGRRPRGQRRRRRPAPRRARPRDARRRHARRPTPSWRP